MRGLVTGFWHPFNHTGPPEDSQTQVISNCTFQNFYKPVKSIHKTNHFTNIKQNIHNIQKQIFQRVSPFSNNPAKWAHEVLSTIVFINTRLKKKERTEKKQHITHNGNYQYQMAASCTYHLPLSCCSTRAIQKSLTLDENIWVFWREKKGQENGPLAGKKRHDRKNKSTRQRNKRGDRKGDYNDSPEIPEGEKIKLKMMSFVFIRWNSNIKFHVPIPSNIKFHVQMPSNAEFLATLNFMCKHLATLKFVCQHLVTNIKFHVQINTQESN